MANQTHEPPHQCRMHYDPTVKGVWIGHGVDLHPLCGQSEYIGVTSVTEAVDCMKCARMMEQSPA